MSDIQQWIAGDLRTQSAEDLVADLNVHAQEILFVGLRNAFRASGRSADEVATILGVDQEMVDQILAGEEDLTLTEIRHTAFALDALVQFKVTPCMSAINVDRMRNVEVLTESLWLDQGDFDDLRATAH